MQYLPRGLKQKFVFSHYVLWLHKVEKIEKKIKQEEICQLLKTLTPKHRKVLKIAGCTVYVQHDG